MFGPRLISLALAAAFTAAAVSPAAAQYSDPAKDGMKAVAAKALVFAPIEVPGFDSGMTSAVIDGDPSAEGPYTLRLAFPAGYRFPPHWHPMAENLTVLSGTLLLGMGERVDDGKLKAYGVGDYLHIPARMAHFGGARGPTVIQLHGQGPFAITVVEGGAK